MKGRGVKCVGEGIGEGYLGRGGRCVGLRGEEEGVWGEGERMKVCGVKGG